MRYLVRGKVIDGKSAALLEAIESGELGRGSIAHKTFLKCMKDARLTTEGEVRWLEVCYCREAFGPGYPVCADCDCTENLEAKLKKLGVPFFMHLEETASPSQSSI